MALGSCNFRDRFHLPLRRPQRAWFTLRSADYTVIKIEESVAEVIENEVTSLKGGEKGEVSRGGESNGEASR